MHEYMTIVLCTLNIFNTVDFDFHSGQNPELLDINRIEPRGRYVLLTTFNENIV